MERNRSFRNGHYAKEQAWPQRITRKYAFGMLHNASIRLYLPQHANDWSADIRRLAGNTLIQLKNQ